MQLPDHDAVAFLAHSLQVSLGFLFMLAVIPKLSSPGRFSKNVAEYRVVPRRASRWLAGALIGSEVVLAVTLMSGLLVEVTLPIAAITATAFIVGVGINLERGRQIPCGCFGLRDDRERISSRSVVRLVFLLLAVSVLMAAFYSGATYPVSLFSLSGDGAAVLAYLVDLAALCAAILLLASWLLTLPELLIAATHRLAFADSGSSQGSETTR